MKRLLILAALASLWAGTAASSRASSFGLTYSRQCSSCGFCVRPYNAFSSVTCGVANLGGPGGCGQGGQGGHGGHGGHGGYGGFGGHGCADGSCLFGLGGKFGHGGFAHGGGLLARLHHKRAGVSFDVGDDDGSPGAFGATGPTVPFYGVPTISGGYNPGCHMSGNWGNGSVHVPGHSPPPAPYVTPYSPSNVVWLPPQPFPGMYLPHPGYYGMPYPNPHAAPGHAPPAAPPAQGAVKPASYQQQPYPYQGGYQPMWYYPPQQYQGYAPAYWGYTGQ